MKAKRMIAGAVAAAAAAGAIAVGTTKAPAPKPVRCQEWSVDGGVRELGDRPVPECLRILDAIRRTRP